MAPSETAASSVIATLESTRASSSMRDAQREVVAAHAAELLRERQAEQAHLAHLPDDLVRERVLLVVLGDDRRDHLAGELARRSARSASCSSLSIGVPRSYS